MVVVVSGAPPDLVHPLRSLRSASPYASRRGRSPFALRKEGVQRWLCERGGTALALRRGCV